MGIKFGLQSNVKNFFSFQDSCEEQELWSSDLFIVPEEGQQPKLT